MGKVLKLVIGITRHAGAIPRFLLIVSGWHQIVLDVMGFQKRPYSLSVRPGFRCELRPGTADWWIFIEIFVLQIYARALDDIREARTIVDIGANVGFFDIFAASHNRSARILAFEPLPQNAELLRNNVRDLRDVQVVEEAISDRCGSATLHYVVGDESGSSLAKTSGDGIIVTTTDINTMFTMNNIESCDLLKMDCEGVELSILRAARPETLSRVRSIILEYHNEGEISSLTEALSAAGLSCEVLSDISTIYGSRPS